jgi:hypothetical protein
VVWLVSCFVSQLVNWLFVWSVGWLEVGGLVG